MDLHWNIYKMITIPFVSGVYPVWFIHKEKWFRKGHERNNSRIFGTSIKWFCRYSKLIDKEMNKGNQHRSYNIEKKMFTFDIINDINKNVTLAQLMDIIGNVIHAVSISGIWIYESKWKK